MAITKTLAKTVMTFGLGAAVAFAQATPSPQGTDKKTDPHGQGAHSADHGMSTNKGAGLMVGKADHDFLVNAAQSNMAEIEATRLAQEKASSSEVKEFARKLEQDHQKSSEKLKELAKQKNVDLPTDMGKHAQMVEKFRSLSGDKFDKEFMKMQVSHHKKDVSAFQKQTERSMDSDVKTFASMTLPTLQQHLQEAQQLEGSTRGRSATNSSNTSTPSSGNSSNTSTPASNAPDSTAKPQGSNNPSTTR
ncbi:MAG TPA: DUF4142 domain-containing protein [Bryobacteraceae bacterium]|nr:DUF4142 domain-containing protein [Bryobacteraceae bacterium]